MNRPVALLLLGTAFVAVTALATPSTPARAPVLQADEPMPLFHHKQHRPRLRSQGMGCDKCHPDLSAKAKMSSKAPTLGADARAVCGACHRDQAPSTWGPHLPGQDPGKCSACHEHVPPPADHGAGWRDLHGADALQDAQRCSSCHREAFCVQCHEQKNPGRGRVHTPSWLTLHSVEARTDPTSCGSCHIQDECVACHASGDGRWP